MHRRSKHQTAATQRGLGERDEKVQRALCSGSASENCNTKGVTQLDASGNARSLAKSLRFLKQIEDSSIDVQGNAVKCLGKIVHNFQDQQIGDVLACFPGWLDKHVRLCIPK